MSEIETELKTKFGAIAVGSRVTCSPAPIGTDQDYLVLDSMGSVNLREWLEGNGFQTTTDEDYGEMNDFISWKAGELNVIAAQSGDFYIKFLAASGVCKRLNLLQKKDRILVFRAVLYNEIDPLFQLSNLGGGVPL